MPRTRSNRKDLSERFMLRMPDGLRGKIAASSRKNQMSMNTLILRVLEDSMGKSGGELNAPSDEMLLALYRGMSSEKQQAIFEFLRVGAP